MDQGHRVQVYEKTGKPGGRMAAISDSTFAFDTGAQYFTVRDDRLERYVRSWHMDGIVEPWQGKIMVARAGRLSVEKKMTERWVGIPTMHSIAAHLSVGIDIRFNITISSTQKKDDQWQLTDDQQNIHGPCDVVIIAAPPPQSIGLVESSSILRGRISGLEMQPCLAVMVAFEQPLDVPFDAAFIQGSPVRWAARNNSKPRRGPAECWTLHANAKWSRAHADKQDERRIPLVVDAFFESIGHRRIDPVHQRSSYWESAAAARPLNVGCLWDAQLKIGMCGDWCRMSRVEGAALSGMAMAGRILSLKAGILPAQL
jgi:hypothetical protein